MPRYLPCAYELIHLENRYLSTYSQDILRRFFVSVDDWEADIIDQALVRNNGTLEGLPTPIIHHVLSNLELFRREKFFALFGALGESVRLDGWPPEPPPGVILLLADERPQARSWVKRQITPGTSIIVELLPMSALGNVFTAILGRLASGDREAMQTDIIFKSILPPSLLWPEVPFILRLLSHNAIRKGLIKLPGLDFAHLVIGHLHDVEKRSSNLSDSNEHSPQ
jgi:senataxin